MIAPEIDSYLRNEKRTLDEVLLQAATGRVLHSIRRQFMEEKGDSKGVRLSMPLFCERQAAYKALGFPARHPEPRTVIKWLGGDLFEVAVLTVAQLAGCELGVGQSEVFLDLGDGVRVKGHIDEMLRYKGSYYIVEVKSVTQQGLDDFQADPVKWSDSWGYRAQANRYAFAAGTDGILFVVVCRDTGHIAEKVFPKDKDLLDRDIAAFRRILKAQSPEEFPRAFEPEPEYTSVQGKDKIPDGVEAERRGSWYRWKTGRRVLGVRCSYCPFSQNACFQNVIVETNGGKPVMVIA